MNDQEIIQLYWDRDEFAISATASKYGKFCLHIISNILRSREDCEECINDTYLGLWNSIPDARPVRFPAYIGRIARNSALTMYDWLTAEKRNPEATCSLDELGDCVSGNETVENALEFGQLENAISEFLWMQSEEKRTIFIRRYWYFESISDICHATGYSESKIKSILVRLRQKLRIFLESEGFTI